MLARVGRGRSGWCFVLCDGLSSQEVDTAFMGQWMDASATDALGLGTLHLRIRALCPADFQSCLGAAIEGLERKEPLGPSSCIVQFVLATEIETDAVTHVLNQMHTALQADYGEALVRVSAMGSEWLGLLGQPSQHKPALEDYLSDDRLTYVDQGIFPKGSPHPDHFETLARFKDKSGHVITATHVLSGTEPDAVLSALDQAMVTSAAHRLNEDPNLHLTVNVCRTTLLDERWHERLKALRENHAAAISRMIFEVTEWPARAAHTPLFKSSRALTTLGSELWLDDFGAGLTSFNEVFVDGITGIKIDRSLLRHAYADGDAFGVLDTVTSFAARMGKVCVIEGAENDDERQFAEDHGATHVQGYFSGRI